MTREYEIEKAVRHFQTILEEQLDRSDRISSGEDWIDYSDVSPLVIGICLGDGIGPEISRQSQRILEHVMADDVQSGSVVFKVIDGLTIENRIQHMKAIPDDVLSALKACHVILKGPTTTPQKGDGMPNIESANVAMRRALDLFACVRPVKVPENAIDWVFFRENTEGAYVLGSQGIDVEDVSFDFKVITEAGAERIIRMAFEYAQNNGKKRVTVVTKSNVVKTTDGRFSEVAKRVAQEYPDIHCDEWYIDIMTAKLLDPSRRSEFEVMVMPNLYGDILTDEASQLQGGVGTAGSANIGKRWAMFEAVHGSAPRMVQEGRSQYADPSSMIKAATMLLRHIGRIEQAERVEKALEICTVYERNKMLTGRSNGCTGSEFSDYVMSWIDRNDLLDVWCQFREA